MHNSAQLRCFENGNDDFGVEAFWIGDAARVGYFVPLNGPLNGHPPSLYTIVACAFKWKSSAARSAFNLTAETQGLSSNVHSIGTTEPMRPGGTSAQTSRFISIA